MLSTRIQQAGYKVQVKDTRNAYLILVIIPDENVTDDRIILKRILKEQTVTISRPKYLSTVIRGEVPCTQR